MKLKILIVCFLSLPFVLVAQVNSPAKYDWNETGEWLETPEKIQDYSAYVLKDNRIIELMVDESTKPNGYSSMKVVHKVIYINNDKGIEEQNKVVIPLIDVKDVLEIKARSISKDGKVTNLDEDNIKDISNYEEYGAFKIFALEGVQKDGQIEYLYKLAMNPDFYGSESIQSHVPVKEANFTIISPDEWVYRTKSYNGLEPMERIELENGKSAWIGSYANVPEFREETYAGINGYKQQVRYVLNNGPNGRELFNWSSTAGNMRDVFSVPKGTNIKPILKAIKAKSLNEEELIIALEEYIKNNYSLKPSSRQNRANLDQVISRRYGDDVDITKIYQAVLNNRGIPYHLVLTADRTENIFDEEFSYPSGMTDVMLYFPQHKKFITPVRSDMRFGIAPANLGGQQALFIGPDQGHRIAEIPMADHTLNKNNRYATLTLNEDMTSVNMDYRMGNNRL